MALRYLSNILKKNCQTRRASYCLCAVIELGIEGFRRALPVACPNQKLLSIDVLG